ncbi:MAG: deoxyribose-phosphate aldolase [Candidatus Thermoplasmatota archaeon]|nr:deoxyribose-phosphate aldolase [Candidatus Thermoplasmatota archaeon]
MKISEYIDHTILKPDATTNQVKTFCSEAKEYGFASVCVNPVHAPLVARELEGTSVKTCVVVGFPLGANASSVKAYEAKTAVEQGADEVDMVINVGSLKDGDYEAVEKDIKAVVAASGKSHVKVIFETCLLTDAEKLKACELSLKAGAHFVKTSTGFGSGGATIEDVALMRKAVGNGAGVKASGGIRDYKTAMAMIEAGASRIGTSSGVKIVKEAK